MKKRMNACLSRMVYRKPTYTDVCSHVQCEHYPAQNWAVLSSPINVQGLFMIRLALRNKFSFLNVLCIYEVISNCVFILTVLL